MEAIDGTYIVRYGNFINFIATSNIIFRLLLFAIMILMLLALIEFGAVNKINHKAMYVFQLFIVHTQTMTIN